MPCATFAADLDSVIVPVLSGGAILASEVTYRLPTENPSQDAVRMAAVDLA
ncbi:hypothetical protein [Nocardia sp. NPDC049526]|uniref:hypothetical protein n=1 Tax=Nocardia sp. NPDC049526 TaxID=3364316 RepID=UPI00379BA920